MPFTFSHPAIVIPFKWLPKKWFSMTGLVVGSVIPDFESFITLGPGKAYSHSLPGVFWFDFPFALLVCFLFHDIVKRPLLEHLPGFLKRRFYRYKTFNWNQYFKNNIVVVFISLLIGISTHLLWDKFTHDTEFLPGAITRVRLGGYDTLLFLWLQYISSLAGLLVVVIFILRYPRQINVPYVPIIKYWLTAGITVLIVIGFRLATVNLHRFDYLDIIINVVISAFLIGIIIASLCSREFLDKV